MTLTFELDLDRPFTSEVIARAQRHTHRADCSPWTTKVTGNNHSIITSVQHSQTGYLARTEAYLRAKFHLDPSNRLATVNKRYRQTDRTDRQRTDIKGRTVLQTVAQKSEHFSNFKNNFFASLTPFNKHTKLSQILSCLSSQGGNQERILNDYISKFRKMTIHGVHTPLLHR